MSLRDFQSALADLYIKTSFRNRYLRGPEAALKGYRLSSEEARALSRIDRVRLNGFCESLAAKNSSRLRAVFERTAKLLGKRFSALYHEYGDRHSDLTEWPEKLEAFANLLFSVLRDEGLPARAREQARFEYVKAMLNHGLSRGIGEAVARRLALTAYPAKSLDVDGNKLRLRAGFVERFSSDLTRPRTRATKDRRPGHILFYQTSPHQPVQTAYLKELHDPERSGG